MEHFYVTTPIYYVNDKPHIGHAYTTILADVLARYHRLLGVETHFLTGTDEHGQKVYNAARKGGISPQKHCDETVVRFQDLWKKLGISNDDFIRTTEPRHKEVVRGILQDLFDRGEIYAGEYEGWYAVTEERFYTEKDLVDGKSPEGNAVERIVETNYFFRMGKYQAWLVDYIEKHPRFIQPEFRRNETLGFLRRPLGDLCISRPKTRLPWGIELPFDENYVCYVWFDALVNYISAPGFRRDEARFAKVWPASIHLIGKDILTTHTVYWPTMLRAIGLPMPETIFAHGWWLSGTTKMSKSLGNVVDPMAMIDRWGVDAFRYFLLAEMTLGQDSSFTEEAFVSRYNTDLANDLGNLASRVLKMIERNCGGAIPAPGEPGPEEEALREAVLGAASAVRSKIAETAPDRCIAAVLEAVRAANRYFDRAKPWVLAKEGDRKRLGTVLYAGAETLRIVSGLLHPVMPRKMGEIRVSLGIPEGGAVPSMESLGQWGALAPGTPLGAVGTLFPRIDPGRTDAGPAAARDSRGETSAAPGERTPQIEGVAIIDLDTFFRVKLTTAKVIGAEGVPKTSKLLRLELEVGDARRQIVAGIAEYYRPEEILGKTIVIVANLQPATIRGVESNGMLLAAKKGGTLRLLTVDGEIPSGASIG